MKDKKYYSAILLAGGKSSRMGQDKSSIVIGGKSFTQIQLAKLCNLGIEDILVSGYGSGMIADEHPGDGPLGGLLTCLKRIREESCLVLPVDVPLLKEETLLALMKKHEEHKKAVTIVTHGEKEEYLIGVYDKTLLPAIERQLKDGKRAVRKLLYQVGYEELLLENAGEEFLNCNSPENLERIKELL